MSQDFVSRSENINDVIHYLRAECEFEILKLTSFVTNNLIHFEKKSALSAVPRQVPVEEEDYQDIFDFDHPV